MKSIFTSALLTARVLLSNKNTFSPLMATFYVTQTWSDSIFLNFLMKTQGFFFGFFSLGFLFYISPTAFCDNSGGGLNMDEGPCVAGIINLHQDILVFLLFLLFVTTVIFGYACYYFKGERGRRNYAAWLATEELIRRQPLNAGFDLVTGLLFVGMVTLLYFICPSQGSSLISAMETAEVAEVAAIKSELLGKPAVVAERFKPFNNTVYNALQQNLSFQVEGKFYQNKSYVSELRFIGNMTKNGEFVGIRGGHQRHVDLIRDINQFYTTLSSQPRDKNYISQLDAACRGVEKFDMLYLLQNYTHNNKNINMVLFEVLNMELAQNVPLDFNNPRDRAAVELLAYKYAWANVYGLTNPEMVTPPAFMSKFK